MSGGEISGLEEVFLPAGAEQDLAWKHAPHCQHRAFLPSGSTLYTSLSAEKADELLVRGLVANDLDALAAIYDTHAGTVLGHVLGLGCDVGTAEAAVVETFRRLWRIAPVLDPKRVSLRGWLLLTARWLVQRTSPVC